MPWFPPKLLFYKSYLKSTKSGSGIGLLTEHCTLICNVSKGTKCGLSQLSKNLGMLLDQSLHLKKKIQGIRVDRKV